LASRKAGLRPLDGYIRVSRRMGREGPGYISPDVQLKAGALVRPAGPVLVDVPLCNSDALVRRPTLDRFA